MSEQLFRIDSSESTLLLLSLDQAIPAVIYYGAKLYCEVDAKTAQTLVSDAIPNAKLDERSQLSLLPENSRGFFGEPGLQGHRNGKHFTHRFSLTESQHKADSLCFLASDKDADLQLKVDISLDEKSNVFCWKHTLTNTSETAYTLDYFQD